MKIGLRIIGGIAALIVLALSALFVFFSVPDMPRAELVAKYAGPPSQFLTLETGAAKGAVVHYRDQGPKDGAVLVLLHGSNASLHTWEPWVKELKDEFRIITLDLPGHGLTGPVPGDDYGQKAMTDFVAEVTAQLGIWKFALAGNSMGGGVTARFALDYPDRLTAAVLLNAGGLPSKMQSNPGLGFLIARMPVVREIMRFVSPRSIFEGGLKQAFHVPAQVTPEMVDRYWELNRGPGMRAATLKRFSTPWDFTLREKAKDIKVPVLILWGRHDNLVPVDVGEAYRDAISGSQLIIYENAGHIPMEELPAQSAGDLRKFLNTLPAAP